MAEQPDPAGGKPTTIGDVPAQAFVKILGSLSARDLARASLVAQAWRAAAADEQLWKPLLRADWLQEEPVTVTGERRATCREAYGWWAQEFARDDKPALRTALHAWQSIKAYVDKRLPEVLQSLRPGVSFAEVEAAGQQLGHPLPAGLAAIYRVHNGQQLLVDMVRDENAKVPGAEQQLQQWCQARAASKATAAGQDEDQQEDEEEEGDGPKGYSSREVHQSIVHGLFGGYSFYDHLVCTRLLPLDRALWWTKTFRQRRVLRVEGPCLVFAASFNLRKFFTVHLETGQVYVNMPHKALPAGPELTAPGAPPAQGGAAAAAPAGPSAPAPSETQASPEVRAPLPPGGVLGWFSEYARRLRTGWYQVSPLDPEHDWSLGVCLFAVSPPDMVEAVTRGVRVSVSTIYAPEVSPPGQHTFSYSVRFRLDSCEEQAATAAALAERAEGPGGGGSSALLLGGKPVLQCQLSSRHWVIRDAQGEVSDEVRGSGVIGQYPILEAGGEPFTYQSCTHQPGHLGYMEGDFKFVEGTLKTRTGAEWDVRCPTFTLKVPTYIF